MGFGAHVAGDQANDALDLRRIVAGAGVDAAFAEAVEPQDAIGVHHDLDDGGVGQRRGDARSHSCAEHRAAAICGKRVGHGWASMMFWVSSVRRSEEHTSELQSLMRISYAVFCLKKKKNHKTT